jgi:hypothetical protein
MPSGTARRESCPAAGTTAATDIGVIEVIVRPAPPIRTRTPIQQGYFRTPTRGL